MLYEINIDPMLNHNDPVYVFLEKELEGCEPSSDVDNLHRQAIAINAQYGLELVHVSPVFNH